MRIESDAMPKTKTAASKFLSLVLRHHPEVIDMQLDENGWLPIDKLIENANRFGNALTLELVHDVVATNDKRRFALSEDGLRIRANQGHSVAGVNLGLVPASPPAKLYHGTVNAFLPSIRRQGLQKRSRNHVHLSADVETATKVASRRGKPVILEVLAEKMEGTGFVFYLSENGVWLTSSVPVDFLAFPAP